jgi:PAS domain S-box-containing protein
MDRVFGIDKSYERSVEGWINLVHPDDRAMMDDYFKNEVLGLRRPFEKEYRIIRQDDQAVRWMHGMGALERDDSNRLVKMLGTIQDITERKQAVDAAKEFSERLKIAARATRIGIWEWDIVNNNLIWDDTICEIYGVPHGDFTGGVGEWSGHLHPDDRDRVGIELQAAQRGEREYAPEFRIIWPDGSLHHIKANSQTFFDENGKPLRMVGTNHDITERKRAEENLRKKNAEISRFTYMVSHDLKSPLVTIKTFLGYLEEDFKTNKAESAAKDLGYIHSAADKMELLLNDLLDFVRLGHLKIELVWMSLQEIVEEALNLVAGQIAGHGVQVEATKEPVWLHGDRSGLVQIFQNLVDNAVKFLGDQPNPRIEIGSEQEAGETVLFVRDNGKGIDPRHRSKLFDLFEKLDPGTPGSGIGLATVRRIVEAHGGKIEAHSDGPGKGTTFRFTLAKTTRNLPL